MISFSSYHLLKTLSRRGSLLAMAVCVMASFAFFSQPGMAQQRVSVVALVNGEPITNLDLENRMAFLRLLSNLQMSEEDFKTDTLQKLIAEKIKFQAAKKQFGAYLQEASQQARQLIDDSFKRGDKSGTQVLKEGGITLSTVTDKYIADILWSSVLRSRFPRQFENLDNLAQLELEKLKAAQNEPQVKLSEILLQPTPNRPIEKTSELANKIIEALGQNANFSSIASQYSEAATASQGGRVNWMRVSQLPPVLRSSLAEADEGDIIGPLVLDGRIYILKKDGYRENGLADPKAAKLTLARAVMPLTSEASNEERMAAGQKLMAQADAINNCEEMAALNTELGSDALPLLRDLQVGSLSPQLQDIIMPLQLGQKSPALPFAEGMTVFMVCEHTQPTADLPDIETLKQVEFEKLFTSISGRYLLRLQRKAVIDYRS